MYNIIVTRKLSVKIALNEGDVNSLEEAIADAKTCILNGEFGDGYDGDEILEDEITAVQVDESDVENLPGRV